MKQKQAREAMDEKGKGRKNTAETILILCT